MKKRIAVIGATGQQGGGLCRALADSEEFELRALSRNPNSEAAGALKSQGIEVVEADLDQPSSLDDAFEGVYGVFAVTNYWELNSAAREKLQAKNVADACRKANIEHVVWSTLEDTRDYIPATSSAMPMLEGEYRVPHLDCKSEANSYFEGLPATFLITSFFWDNMVNFGMSPKLDQDGIYRWYMPMGDAKLAGHAAQDIGNVVAAIFADPNRFLGRSIGIQAEALTLAEMASTVAKVFEVPVEYVALDADAYRSQPFDGAKEIGNNLQYFRDWNAEFLELRSSALMRELNPNCMNFENFVRSRADSIKAVMNAPHN